MAIGSGKRPFATARTLQPQRGERQGLGGKGMGSDSDTDRLPQKGPERDKRRLERSQEVGKGA